MHLNWIDDVANLIFVGAYWVKDVLWLRLLTVLGSFVIIPFYLLQKEPLWIPMVWSCVFISINAARAWGIVKERRPIAFTSDEQFLFDKIFGTLSPDQFKRLLSIGEWQDLDLGYVLHSVGDAPDSVEAVVRGELEERRNGRVLGHAGPGDLAGVASVVGGSPEFCDTRVTQPARVMRWRIADLQKFVGVDERLTSAIRKIAAASIAHKLIRIVQAEY